MDLLKKIDYILDKKTKWTTLVMIVLVLIGTFTELVGVSIVLPVINLAVQPEEIYGNTYCRVIMKVTGFTGVKEIILILIACMALVYIFKAVYLVWMNNKIYVFATKIQCNLSVRLMKAYIGRSYPFFLNKNSSEIIRGIASDTSLFRGVVQNCMMLASSFCLTITLFAYLLKTNLVITVLVGGLSAGSILINVILLGKKLQQCGRDNQKLVGRSYRILFESFHGVKETKILQKESYYTGAYEHVAREQVKLSKRSNFYQIMPKYALESIAICGILIYLAAAVLLYGGYAKMVGQLSVFAVAAFKLLPAINGIYAYIGAILSQKAAVDMVYDDLVECEAEQKRDYRYVQEPNAEKIKYDSDISLNNVAFHYEDNDMLVLKDINMRINKGESVGVVGVSGGGKTTVIDVILGLLEPVSGSVTVDGKDIRENYGGWLHRIGYIPQDIYLSDASIRENIAYGVSAESIDETKLVSAVEKAQLTEFIQGLPNGLDTEIGEAGVRLSGGQRQRIGIARALYSDPDVLILDEATSALDNSTEKEVMDAIEHLQGEKTLIIIAHRLSTVRKCDRIYEIRDGYAYEKESV